MLKSAKQETVSQGARVRRSRTFAATKERQMQNRKVSSGAVLPLEVAFLKPTGFSPLIICGLPDTEKPTLRVHLSSGTKEVRDRF